MFLYNRELTHFGIKGQKWGVRRYQNKDGSLTPAGKKRLSKDYKKLVTDAQKSVNRNHNDRYLKAYNKAADDMNNGEIDKYNAAYDKKLGSKAKDHDYANDDEYMNGYMKLFSDRVAKYYNEALLSEIGSNKSYQKAKELCDKYDMAKFDDFVKTNQAEIDEIRKLVG